MKKINLAIGIHNHQPVGNFDFVFEHAYKSAYKPFIEILEKHPKIKIAQHYTGALLQWLKENHPEFIEKLKQLVKRNQIEIITGGFYEPILAIIPDQDKIDQIKKLTDFIIENFDTKPLGMWLAERVWEQHIVKSIVEAGVKYVIIDDTHFRYAGLIGEKLLGYYITEEQGYALNVFPISKTLRYTIPFQPVEKTINYLREVSSETETRLVVYADDGEKFGVWPNTYEHVYDRGWLDDFFSALEENLDWINILHFSEIIKSIKPTGRIYLPNASYAEMMHWALPADAYVDYEKLENKLKEESKYEQYSRFFRGGFWRNFLVKYPESNNMHKKMLRVSKRARELQKKGKDVKKALDKIFAAQCNDPYWHGIFGGLYLTHLRTQIYRNLISAEKELDEIENINSIRYEITDFDRDGNDEIIIESPVFNIYISPERGGSLFEIDFKPAAFNILDVLTRRKEGYHEKLLELNKYKTDPTNQGIASIHDTLTAKESGLEKFLHYDKYQRGALIDHFLEENTTLENFYTCSFKEAGDFTGKTYRLNKIELKENKLLVELSRTGKIKSQNQEGKIEVTKQIIIDKNEIKFKYRIFNLTDEPLDIWFGSEFDWNFLAPDAEDRFFYSPGINIKDKKLKSMGELENVTGFGIIDMWLGVDARLEFSRRTNIWRFPIETVSLSEAGVEKVYQGSAILAHWKIKLEKLWEVEIKNIFKLLK